MPPQRLRSWGHKIAMVVNMADSMHGFMARLKIQASANGLALLIQSIQERTFSFLKINYGVITTISHEVTKPKFWLGNFQEFCETSTYM